MLEFQGIDHDEEHQGNHDPFFGILIRRLSGDDPEGFADFRVTLTATDGTGAEVVVRHREADRWVVLMHKVAGALLAAGVYADA